MDLDDSQLAAINSSVRKMAAIAEDKMVGTTDRNLAKSAAKPNPIAKALRCLMKIHGETCKDLALALQVNNVEHVTLSLRNWRSGRSWPRKTSSLKFLQKVECHYELPKGYFAALIADTDAATKMAERERSPFQRALIYEMNIHCDTSMSLAKAISRDNHVNIASTLSHWKYGRSKPFRSVSQFLLARIERHYGLPNGYFQSLQFKPVSLRHAVAKLGLPWTTTVRWHLPPDFEQRAITQQEEIATWISVNILGGATRYGKYQSSITSDGFSVRFPKIEGINEHRRPNGRQARRDRNHSSREGYGLTAAPPNLAEEMKAYVQFKTAILPPVEYRRFQNWSAATADAMVFRYGAIFGALAAAPDSAAKGMGVAPSNLAFGMLIFPKVWEWYAEWRERRRGFYSSAEVTMLLEARASLRKPAGWIRQNPHLIHRVSPLENFISDDDIKAAKANWDSTCDKCIDVLTGYITAISRVKEIHRDPFEAILPILESDSPLSEYKKITSEILKRLPNEKNSSVGAAVAVRSYLMIRLAMHLAFRQRNLRDLMIRRRGEGQRSLSELESLRRGEMRWSEDAGGWEIVAPAKAFKNAKSSFFSGRPFRMLLQDSEGLYDYIEEYLHRYRPVLLAGRCDPGTFFVRSAKSSLRSPEYDLFSFYRAWKAIIQKYGVYNPYTGRGAIAGLLPHGSHAVRDVIATHVLKQTRSYELASFAIHDTVETVKRHYARFLPHEKVAIAAESLNQVWLEEGSATIQSNRLSR